MFTILESLLEVFGEGMEEGDKFSLLQAVALNTLNMFGTGPFITLPFLLESTVPSGPQALIGYALAALICVNDALVWGELGSMMPFSGGSYVYLKELFGPEKDGYGQLFSFLFVWQFFLSGPLEVASGFVAAAQYSVYFTGLEHGWVTSLLAFSLCCSSLVLLFRSNVHTGQISVVLWTLTLFVIAFTIVSGFYFFDSDHLSTPRDAFSHPGRVVLGLGAAGRFGVYDFTGYFDVNQIGGEVVNPRRTIPIAAISTAVIVGIVYFFVIVAILGVLPYSGPDGIVQLAADSSDKANFVGSLFAEELFGRAFAIVFTCFIICTILGSCHALVVGYIRIPYAASRDGYFFKYFEHLSSSRPGLPDRSLWVVGGLSALACFLDLEVLLEGMLTTRLLLQFIPQALGVMLYRHTHPEVERPFRIPLYPLPNIIAAVGFFFIFCTTDSLLLFDGKPLLEIAVAFIAIGIVAFLAWERWGEGSPKPEPVEMVTTEA